MVSTPSGREPLSTRGTVIGVVGALLTGAIVAVQGRVNGALGAALGDGYLTALISFVLGMLVVLIALAISSRARAGIGIVAAKLRTREIPWWIVLGGLSGAFFVLSQSLTVSILGIAIFTVAVVFGQTISGLLIDARGLASAPARRITPRRLLGSLMMLAAVVLVVSTQLIGDIPIWAVVLPVVAGFAAAWQQAVNGEVRVISGSPITATFINFLVGLLVLIVAVAVNLAITGPPTRFPSDPLLYSGAIVGVAFIALGSILAPRIGVLVLSLGTISGQLIAALVLDLVVPTPGHPLGITSVVGTAVTLVALGVASLPGRIPGNRGREATAR